MEFRRRLKSTVALDYGAQIDEVLFQFNVGPYHWLLKKTEHPRAIWAIGRILQDPKKARALVGSLRAYGWRYCLINCLGDQ